MSWTAPLNTCWHGWWAVGFFVVASVVNSAELLPSNTSEDVHTTIQRSVQSNERDWKAAPAYDFLERDLQADGGTRTFQVMMIEGSPYQRLIAINGKPLSPGQQAEEQKKLDAVTARRRGESRYARNERISKYEKERERDYSLTQELSKAFDFALSGEQQLNGFAVYVLQATPRPGYRPPTLETQVLTGMKGTLWIDKKSYQWVKIEAEVIHPVSIVGFLARVEPGTRFELEKAPVSDGVWLAKHFSMRSHAKILSVFNHNSSADETYWNYQKAGSPAGVSSGK
jgi:hypothetical protein